MPEKTSGPREKRLSPEIWREYQREQWIDAGGQNPDDFETGATGRRSSRDKESP
ncbi:hypothetical protein [Thermanaeromonas sp. C210]|uniref:hypothetical protein n=1 Tax=Thermanaeromonas sp. C210 TaxID=2731925 RepID=UPI001567466F|nr:hypothetical protein [Thermanaeromonas sp. C210]